MNLISCKNCKTPFYISPSRLSFRKYCSKSCAMEDEYGFRPKEKKCKICGNTFIITSQLRMQDKVCSQECRYENILRSSRKQSANKKNQVVKRKCRECGKEVVSTAYCVTNFCGGKYGECYKRYLSRTRKGKKNPAYRNGLSKKGVYTGKHLQACSKYRKSFLEKHSYLFCEVCKVNANGTPRFEVHHIYYASLYPKHKELHNPKNLILICIQCHNDFHSGKMRSEIFLKLEKERGLKELFKTI